MKDLKRLFQLLKEYKSNLFFGIVFNILTAIFTVISIPLIMPFFQILFSTSKLESPKGGSAFELKLKGFFETLIQSYEQHTAVFIVCGLIISSFFLKNLFRYLAFSVMAPVRSGVIVDLRNQLFNNYLNLEVNQIKTQAKGDLITRISSDVQEVEYSILQFLQVLIQSPLIIVGSVMFMLFLNAKLTLLVFVLLIFIAFVMGNISRVLKKDSTVLQEELSNLVSTTDESISGWLSIRTFNAKDNWKQRFQHANQRYGKTFVQFLRRRELSSPLSEFLGIVIVAVLLAIGAKLVLDQQMAPESFFAFVLAFYFVIEPAKSFSNAFYHLKRGSVALDRIEELLIHNKKETPSSKSLKRISDINAIVFEDVWFKFPDSEDYVLKQIDLSIPINETTAFVGPSGSGKTSLVLLLLKIYQPTQGRIRINGIDLSDIDTRSWRKLLAFVPQEAFLYNGTIKSNILFGREENQTALSLAITHSFASDIIANKKEGTDYNVGENGNKLSGGQKQRTSIARALYDDPQLLILDEPTSALDAATEQQLSESIQQATKSRSSIIIAHRLSTIKSAHQIVLLEDGQLVETGTHKSLSETNLLYQDYLNYQSF